MPKNPLFSTYRQGENRVTSSMLAVFERIDLSLLESMLGAAAGESTLQMVRFVNQPAGKGASVPDARIAAEFSYRFEVKTATGEVRRVQLQEHLQSLAEEAGDERLFVVTPDPSEPDLVRDIDDRRLVWFNFRSLYDAIDASLAEGLGSSQVSQQTTFLLRELQALLVAEGLVDYDDVVVVAARLAYGQYLRHGAYVCQPGRSFRDGLRYMAFYTEGYIQQEVARILYRADEVTFTYDEVERRRSLGGQEEKVAATIDAMLKGGERPEGIEQSVFVLSRRDDPETERLEAPIKNSAVARSGRPVAWVMSQRYTTLSKLTQPGTTRTSDLDRL